MHTKPLARLEELRQKRAGLIDRMRELADTSSEYLTSEETREFDQAEKEVDRLSSTIKAMEAEHGYGGKLTRAAAIGDHGLIGADGVATDLGSEQRMADWAKTRYETPEFMQDGEPSLGRVIRGMVTGEWAGADIERRALSEGTDSAGGFLTPEVLGATVIDRVRKKAKVLQAGARVIPMESDKQFFPRLASGVTGAWRAENTAVAESDPVFERITFQAKTLAVLTRLSYELFDDLTDEGARAIENELVQALSLEVDRAALRGSGTSNQPTGIRNQAGVTIQSLATNGAAPTYAALVNAVAAIQANNLEPNASIFSSRTGRTLSNLADTTGQPLRKPPLVEDLLILVSNQVPNDLTHGSSSVASEIYTAQWDQLLVGVRPRVRIEATRVGQGEGGFPVNVKASSDRYIDTMQVALLAWIRADIQLAHPEAFVVTTGAIE